MGNLVAARASRKRPGKTTGSNAMFQNAARDFLERVPPLQKTAFAAWVASLKTKNVVLDFAVRKLGYEPHSLSDRGQDKWVIEEIFNGKMGGFFLDLGAADGFSESNTYVLEKRYKWNGICIEPHPVLFDRLVNRYKRSCTVVSCAVDAERGSQEFVLAGQMSGLITEDSDNSEKRRPELIGTARAQGRTRVVETLPLVDLLDRYEAPTQIDYFSFDVEGLETRILRNFNFDKYVFLALTIERPTPELNDNLFRNGYHFVRNSLYDTFYIHESLPNFSEVRRESFQQLPPKSF